jgi:ubiquinone/menaquinone biosynthesis C-methylase UbiE
VTRANDSSGPAPAAPSDGLPARQQETYSHGHHRSVLAAHARRTAESSAAYLLPHLRPTDRLLDVGAGPGTITADLAGRVAEVVGLDTAPAAVVAAQALVASRGLTNVRIDVGDVYALQAATGTYDVVHAHQVLQHLADPVAALREMRRVCRPGGLVAVRDADYATMTWFPETPALQRWLEAGFSEVTATGSVWCYASAEDLAWWSQTWAERLTESSFATSALEYGLADRAELERLAEGWLAFGEDPRAWFLVPHGEVLAVA